MQDNLKHEDIKEKVKSKGTPKFSSESKTILPFTDMRIRDKMLIFCNEAVKSEMLMRCPGIRTEQLDM